MSIQTKNWNIQFENVASTNKSEVKVSAMVTVPSAAYEPVLIQAADRSPTHLQLDLQLTRKPVIGNNIAVEKPVCFSVFDLISYQSVSVYHRGEVILSISGIQPAA
ncbi:hypothetical protein NJC40_25320 [Pseudomonas sp. 21LCFQ02]|uniref:hypothetical protein n=1 Tax=Pseudomonas sp. 21LCFQ02 TaxID=2957505 RepID=UPI00209B0155|nr:hypothetical protein [Pseudomonas sp. 21LCFQ02]MCO8171094.1 hypothetical protein [Pseudomonas sp. 21LCFQ02]